MNDFLYPGILSSVALLVYYFTLFKAGTARVKYNIQAPSHDGPEEYVRKVRVHINTLEHLALFLPGLWLFSIAVDPIWGTWPSATDYIRPATRSTTTDTGFSGTTSASV